MAHAAEVLGLSPRQVQRLLRTFRVEGAPALRHKARGRPSNKHLRDDAWDLALALVRESYAGFGPTLAAEKLAERHGVSVSRETLRKWMIEDGLWPLRQQRRQFHQPRLRRPHRAPPRQVPKVCPADSLLVRPNDVAPRRPFD